MRTAGDALALELVSAEPARPSAVSLGPQAEHTQVCDGRSACLAATAHVGAHGCEFGR